MRVKATAVVDIYMDSMPFIKKDKQYILTVKGQHYEYLYDGNFFYVDRKWFRGDVPVNKVEGLI